MAWERNEAYQVRIDLGPTPPCSSCYVPHRDTIVPNGSRKALRAPWPIAIGLPCNCLPFPPNANSSAIDLQHVALTWDNHGNPTTATPGLFTQYAVVEAGAQVPIPDCGFLWQYLQPSIAAYPSADQHAQATPDPWTPGQMYNVTDAGVTWWYDKRTAPTADDLLFAKYLSAFGFWKDKVIPNPCATSTTWPNVSLSVEGFQHNTRVFSLSGGSVQTDPSNQCFDKRANARSGGSPTDFSSNSREYRVADLSYDSAYAESYWFGEVFVVNSGGQTPIALSLVSDTTTIQNAGDLGRLLETKPFTLSMGDTLWFLDMLSTTCLDSTILRDTTTHCRALELVVSLIDSASGAPLQVLKTVESLCRLMHVDSGFGTNEFLVMASTGTVYLRADIRELDSTVATITCEGEIVHVDSLWSERLGKQGAGTSRQTPSTPELSFLASYPNPSRQGTVLEYETGHAGIVRAQLFSIFGVLVRDVLTEQQEPGRHAVPLDVSGLESGAYVWRVSLDGVAIVRNMIVVR